MPNSHRGKQVKFFSRNVWSYNNEYIKKDCNSTNHYDHFILRIYIYQA